MNRIPFEDKLCDFMAPFTNDECTREVLQLMARHPHTRLAGLAIRCAVDWRKFDVERSLKLLIDRRLVKTAPQNGVTVYWLTSEEPQKSLAQKVSNLDLAQWYTILKRCRLPHPQSAYRSSLSQRERDILAAARHQSAFVLPVMPRFVK